METRKQLVSDTMACQITVVMIISHGIEKQTANWIQNILMVCVLHAGHQVKGIHFAVCHAELNAILNKNSIDLKGCIIYVALFPCNECAKLIIQSGISEVVYVNDKYHDKDEMKASRKLLEMAGVKYRYNCGRCAYSFPLISCQYTQKGNSFQAQAEL